jgi:hypothetical protein
MQASHQIMRINPWREWYTSLLSWPPRSSTACTKRAWSAVVQRIRGARDLRFDPPAGRDALVAARLNAHPCGSRWPRRPAALPPCAGVPSPRLRPGGSAPGLGFAKNPTSPLPSSAYDAVLGSGDGGFARAGASLAAADEEAGGLIRRERFGRFLCSIGGGSSNGKGHSLAAQPQRSNGMEDGLQKLLANPLLLGIRRSYTS